MALREMPSVLEKRFCLAADDPFAPGNEAHDHSLLRDAHRSFAIRISFAAASSALQCAPTHIEPAAPLDLKESSTINQYRLTVPFDAALSAPCHATADLVQ
ncbi:hypothetical protein [Caballeronia humi]|uniref:hypothetical protein n=1 Tax=Caballeronia humi TaxID=326474 RepID=UPI000A7ABDE2|nr:hypothetical protein [Caballeronia humi]